MASTPAKDSFKSLRKMVFEAYKNAIFPANLQFLTLCFHSLRSYKKILKLDSYLPRIKKNDNRTTHLFTCTFY